MRHRAISCRPYLKKEWCTYAIQNAIRIEPQEHNRIRFWAAIPELNGRYLRVVTLAAYISPKLMEMRLGFRGAAAQAAVMAECSARRTCARGQLVTEDMSGGGIDSQIHVIRGVSVMLDFDLAQLYGVATGVLLQAVRRNRKRFPVDFMFSLTAQEVARLRSQIVISKATERRGGRRYQFQAFTEQGVAMLSSVLRSERAVRVNIEIMRAFVRLRRAAIVSSKVMALVEDLSKRVDLHDAVITDIVHSIRKLVEGPGKRRSRPIGFTADIETEGE